MAGYALVQSSSAETWAHAVKRAAMFLKRGLNAAEAQALNVVATLVADKQILVKLLEVQVKVQSETRSQAERINYWTDKLTADQNLALIEFRNVVASMPEDVARRIRADALSTRDNSLWGLTERAANAATGGRSRAVLTSPEFTAALNAVDSFFAGVADSLTLGLSTRLRGAMWGETATKNHTGFWFEAGQMVGEIMLSAIITRAPWVASANGSTTVTKATSSCKTAWALTRTSWPATTCPPA